MVSVYDLSFAVRHHYTTLSRTLYTNAANYRPLYLRPLDCVEKIDNIAVTCADIC